LEGELAVSHDVDRVLLTDHNVHDVRTSQGPLEQLKEQQRLACTPNPEDVGYKRQKAGGKLWVRERLESLVDHNSFNEVGSITGQPVYDKETGRLVSFIPA
jgi:acetyl-CoA carboxylase carboxyltransferase component